MSNVKSGIAWSEIYALGEPNVDMQHKMLFEQLSSLIDSCEGGTQLEKVKDALDFLVGYTVRHFNDEEALQISCGYPEYENHKKLHEDFKVTVGELVGTFKESGSTAELSSALHRVVVKWLITHIQGEDKKIGAFLEEKKK